MVKKVAVTVAVPVAVDVAVVVTVAVTTAEEAVIAAVACSSGSGREAVAAVVAVCNTHFSNEIFCFRA